MRSLINDWDCLHTVPVAIITGAASMVAIDSHTDILGNQTWLAWVVIGAVLGGIAAIAISPKDTRRKNAVKWFTSFIFSFVSSPYLSKVISKTWLDGTISVDYLLIVSGTLAFLAWGILNGLQKAFNHIIKSKLSSLSSKPSQK